VPGSIPSTKKTKQDKKQTKEIKDLNNCSKLNTLKPGIYSFILYLPFLNNTKKRQIVTLHKNVASPFLSLRPNLPQIIPPTPYRTLS
jgi:hypothetical protein